MKTPKIITGTDRQLTATWTVNGSVTPISPAAIVRFIMVSKDKETTYTNILTADRNHPSADWPHGLIALVFPSTETSAINARGLAMVELQVEDAGKKLGTFFPVNIVKGNLG